MNFTIGKNSLMKNILEIFFGWKLVMDDNIIDVASLNSDCTSLHTHTLRYYIFKF
jgi:hypothetical protein